MAQQGELGTQQKRAAGAGGASKQRGPSTDATGQIVPHEAAVQTIGALLVSRQRILAGCVPRHVRPDRLIRLMTNELRRVPRLAGCTAQSLVGCFFGAAQLGLEIGPGLGHAYLVPFRNGKTGHDEATLIVGYRGLVDLARRSGQVSTVEAVAVYDGDVFEYERGLEPILRHVPVTEPDPDRLNAVYAILRLRDGGRQFEVMTRQQVDSIRARAKAGNDGPWVTDFEMMARKTVLRRLLKLAPVSVEVERAVSIDEAADDGREQPIDVSPEVLYGMAAGPAPGPTTPPPANGDESPKAEAAPPAPAPAGTNGNGKPCPGADSQDPLDHECADIAARMVVAARERGTRGLDEWAEVAEPRISELPEAPRHDFLRALLLLGGARKIEAFRAAGCTTFERASPGVLARVADGHGADWLKSHGADVPGPDTPAGWAFDSIVRAARAAKGVT